MMHDDEFYAGFDGWDSPNTDRSLPAPAKKKKPTRVLSEQEANLRAFEALNPDVAAWWKDSTFPFAANMKFAVREWGGLTEGQMNAVRKCLDKVRSLREAAAARLATGRHIDVSGVEAAFKRGVPKLFLAANEREFMLKLAKAYSVNKGAIYVSEAGDYYGKIADGKFVRSATCTDEDEADILLALETPLAAAIEYGKRTGKCSCCGRPLSNEESVALGIGPICRGKYFA